MLRVRTCGLALTLVAGLTALAACSGGSGGGDGQAKTSPSPTKPPVVLGYINMEGAPAGSFPEARAGAEAAVAHVNDDLGGIGGRPLRLSVCKTNGTAESSQSCAQRMVSEKPVAIVGGVDLGANASVHVIAAAGIPYVTGSPTLGGELTTSGVYAFSGGTAADLLGVADYLIERRHVKRVHVLHEDLPGLLNTAVSAAGSIFSGKGVAVKLVAEKADAPDFAPSVTAASAGNPDAIIVVFPAQACARIMQSAQALGVKAELYYPGACATPTVVAGRSAALTRSYFASGYVPVGPSGGDAAAADFRKRVPAAQRSPLSEASYGAVLNVVGLMAGEALDSATLKTKLATTRNTPNALAHPYTCDSKQMPLAISVCNSNIRLLQYRGGTFVDVLGAWVNGTQLLGLTG